ncbi:MAG: hypothetical protein AAFN10_21575 [Bacteroidota bacterium]
MLKTSLGFKQALRIIGLLWLMALTLWLMTYVINSLVVFGGTQTIISLVGILLLASTGLAFILGGRGK